MPPICRYISVLWEPNGCEIFGEMFGRWWIVEPSRGEASCYAKSWGEVEARPWRLLGFGPAQALPFLNFSCHFLAFVGALSVASCSTTFGGADNRSSGFNPILDGLGWVHRSCSPISIHKIVIIDNIMFTLTWTISSFARSLQSSSKWFRQDSRKSLTGMVWSARVCVSRSNVAIHTIHLFVSTEHPIKSQYLVLCCQFLGIHTFWIVSVFHGIVVCDAR